MSTEIDTAALRKLAAAATPGPWSRNGARHRLGDEDCIWVSAPGTGDIIAFPIGSQQGDKYHAVAFRDAAFVAAARDALPALLDRLEELQARVDSLTEARRREAETIVILTRERESAGALLTRYRAALRQIADTQDNPQKIALAAMGGSNA